MDSAIRGCTIGLLLLFVGCQSDPEENAGAVPNPGPMAPDDPADAGDGSNACIALAEACGADDTLECGLLFGRPNASTGLPDEACGPACACGETLWQPPPLDDAFLERLRALTLVDPPSGLDTDPYARPEDHVQRPDQVCGVLMGDEADGTYRLQTFDDPAAAAEAGAQITHFGACGLCSSLQDLAVYIGIPDLTEPVRACGIRGFSEGPEGQRTCIEEIGFSAPCADIWSFNTSHTRSVCQEVCLPLLTAAYHEEDGRPNACIQCDEDNSGPVFKAVAGRTRRNSGLPTALCRPCSDVRPVNHDYAF